VTSGQTPVLDPAEARALLDSIDTSTVVGLRDRARPRSAGVRLRNKLIGAKKIATSSMLASMVAAQPNSRQRTAFGFHLRLRLIAAVARSGE
jgi:hypothetical protein